MTAEPGRVEPADVIETVALVYVRDRRVLLVRPDGKGAFYMPGGKKQPGEDDATALAREIREELGVRLDVGSLVPQGLYQAQAYGERPGVSVSIACYSGELDGDPRPGGEIATLRFFSASEYLALSDTAPAVRLIAEHLRSGGVID